MGIKFGEIDSDQILINEYRISVLEGILSWILDNNQNIKRPNSRDIKEIKSSVVVTLELKYPKSGIELKES